MSSSSETPPSPVLSPSLSVDVVTHGSEQAVMCVGGELDVATAMLLQHHLATQLGQGRRHLVIDLAEVPFMDSSGLNIILRAMNETRATGGSLRLAAPAPPVRRVLELTGVTLTIPVHGTVEQALAHS
jgi:stage II sporulation protein AA (anti-sigma F factor antagonist)